MTTAAELVSLDRDYFLNDEAVKLAVKQFMVGEDPDLSEALANMRIILAAYNLDGIVNAWQILGNLRKRELRNSDDPAIRAYYKSYNDPIHSSIE